MPEPNVTLASVPPVFVSQTPFDHQRIGAAAVYCSDGRYGEQMDEFLHQGLGLPRYDRVAVPGGAACLARSRTITMAKGCVTGNGQAKRAWPIRSVHYHPFVPSIRRRILNAKRVIPRPALGVIAHPPGPQGAKSGHPRAQPRRQDQEDRSDALATTRQHIPCDVRDEAHLGLQVLCNRILDQ